MPATMPLLGEVLVMMGVLSKDSLTTALDDFSTGAFRHTFGRYLVEKKIITNDQLQLALLRQRILQDDREHHVTSLGTVHRLLSRLG